jgi:hypothetical protein
LYISQKAVLPETGLAGAEGFAASVSLLGDAFGVWEQEVRKKTQASAAAALKRLLNIGTYNSRHRCARLREFYCKRHGEEQEENTGGLSWRGRYSLLRFLGRLHSVMHRKSGRMMAIGTEIERLGE